jgi:hypothetical protein
MRNRRQKLICGTIMVLSLVPAAGIVLSRGSEGHRVVVTAGTPEQSAGMSLNAVPVEVTTTTTVPPTTPTTETTETTAPTQAPQRPVTSTTTTSVTTAPAPEIQSPSPARRFAISPASGPRHAEVMASGTGCSDDQLGVSLEIRDSLGQAISGDGGAALPDGTWQVPMRFPTVPPGQYTIHANCVRGADVIFQYDNATFELTS